MIFNKEGWSQYSDQTSHSDSHKGKEQNPDGLEGHKGKKRLEEMVRKRRERGETVERAEGEAVANYPTTMVPDQQFSKWKSSSKMRKVFN